MPDTSVKYFHSAMTGAPQLTGQAGSLIGVLDACLVNGFALKSVDSIVITDNVAEMTISTGHSFEAGTVALVAGATPSALNGEQKVLSVLGTKVRFATTGLANQTATGTITAKLAGGGWLKPFSGTNIAAYKSANPQSTGFYVRVDDTPTTYATLRGYENMLDISTGINPFPTTAQGTIYWSKSNVANTTTRDWMVVTDGRLAYVGRQYNVGYAPVYDLSMFGDVLPTKSADAYSYALSGRGAEGSTAAPDTSNLWYADVNGGAALYCARSYTGLGGPCQMRKGFSMPISYGTGLVSGRGNLLYPNPADGGLYLSPVYLMEHITTALRAQLVGYYACPQTLPDNTFYPRDSVVGAVSLPGRILKYIPGGNNGTQQGGSFFDITGPWR